MRSALFTLSAIGAVAAGVALAAATTSAVAGDYYGHSYGYGSGYESYTFGGGYGYDAWARRDGNVFYNAYNSHDGYRRHQGYWERPSDRWNGYRCAWTTGCGYYPRYGYGYGHRWSYGGGRIPYGWSDGGWAWRGDYPREYGERRRHAHWRRDWD